MMKTNGVRSLWGSVFPSFMGLTLFALVSQINSVAPEKLKACIPFSTHSNKTGVCLCYDGKVPEVSCVGVDGMVEIPTDILPRVTTLVIQIGNIGKLLEDDFAGYYDLRNLYLEKLQLHTIHENAFRNLYRLTKLSLQDNRLTTLDLSGRTFRFLTSLSLLDVSINKMTTINQNSFLTILPVVKGASLKVILGQNNISCGCNVYALRRWMTSVNKTFEIEGFTCQNDPERRRYYDIPLSDYPTCIGVVVNEKATCPMCRNVRTNYECNLSPFISCQLGHRCKKSVSYDSTGGLRISSQCQSNDVCGLASYSNKFSCFPENILRGNFNCAYCCTDAVCGVKSPIGRTIDYGYNLCYFIKRTDITQDLFDPKSPVYRAEVLKTKEQIEPVMKGFQGGWYLKVEKIEPSTSNYFKATMRVVVTVFDWNWEPNVFKDLDQRFRIFSEFPNIFTSKTTFIRIRAGLINSFTAKCPTETVWVNGVSITWPETYAESDARIFCTDPNNFDSSQYALRKCNLEPIIHKAHWGLVITSACYHPGRTTMKITTTALVSTEKTPVIAMTLPPKSLSYTPQEAQTTTTQILNFIQNSESLSSTDVGDVVDLLESLSLEKNNLAFGHVSETVLKCLDRVVGASLDTLKKSEEQTKTSTRILDIIDSVGANAPLLPNGQFVFSSPNLGVAATEVSLMETRRLIFSEAASSDGKIGIKVAFSKRTPTTQPEYSNIVIPTQFVLKMLNESQKQAFRRMTFSLHGSKLFDSMGSHRRQSSVRVSDDDGIDRIYEKHHVNGRVLSASVPDIEIEDLSENITMTFQHANENSTNPACVYWDPHLQDGSGDWSTRGCGVVRSDEKSTTCGCNHLTNFALLMDVYQEGGSLSESNREALSIISFIGCGVSLLTLILTLITYSLFKQVNQYDIKGNKTARRKLRRDTPSKILINLCIALVMSNLIFLAGMQDYTFKIAIACKVVAVLLHYSMLASLTWMAVEAFYMYLSLVLVFKTYFSHFMFKISLFAWGVPLIVIIVTLGIDLTDNYGLLGSGLCWIKTPAFYYTFVAPVGLIMLVNFIAFILVIRQLIHMSSGKLNTSDRYGTMQRLRGAVGVLILLGLTWTFAIFAIDSASVVFYYLFAIFNSFQGLFIFIFHCVFRTDAAASCRRFMSCCFQPEEIGISSRDSSGNPTSGQSKGSASSVNITASTTSTMARTSSSNGTSNIYDSIDNSYGSNDYNYMNMPQSSKYVPPNTKFKPPRQQEPNTMITKFTAETDHGKMGHVYSNQPSEYQYNRDMDSPIWPYQQEPPYLPNTKSGFSQEGPSQNVQFTNALITPYHPQESQLPSPVQHPPGSPEYVGYFPGPSQNDDSPVDPNPNPTPVRPEFESSTSSV